MLIDIRSRVAAGPTEAVIALAGQVILGKERQIRLAMACILARGHLLIEDVPGVGKTTLSHALARLLGLDYQRIQFTSDLLPADIIGVAIFDRESSMFIKWSCRLSHGRRFSCRRSARLEKVCIARFAIS